MTVTTRIVHRRGTLNRRTRARARRQTAGWQLPMLGIVALLGLGVFGVGGLVGTSTLTAMSAGLPPPTELDKLGFDQPTIVYDRDGKVELGRFEDERRRVLAYEAIPKTILDATTSAEDRTFWQNAGVDVPALISAVAENASGTSDRGASTITQQLVRARLLPEDVVQAGADRYVRKVKEIVQALRVNEAYPGESGKERVITAYLNEIFYGHGAYGIAAAAEIYFGVHDLSKLTIAQAALLAGLPKSPTTLDPYRYAKRDKKGRLVVAPGSPPLVRRDWVLGGMAATARWGKPDATALEAAYSEPVILAGDRPVRIPGGQFTWQVKRQLQQILGPNADLERGGYRVTTTLDWRAQRIAEKWLAAAAIAPNTSRRAAERFYSRMRIPAAERSWIRDLRGKDLHNAALVALDYRTGDVLAYVGSAGYTRDEVRRRRRRHPSAGFGVEADPVRERLRRETSHARQPAARRHDGVRPQPGLGAARRRPARARARPRAQGAPVLVEHPGDPRAPARRQRPGRRDGREDGHPLRRRPSGLPAGRPRGRTRHRRGATARPRIGIRDDRQRRRASGAAHGPGDPRS
jgi:membrane peptidoglycan carboxypeptidase